MSENYQKYGVEAEEAKFLVDLEKVLHKSIPYEKNISRDTFGFKVKSGNIIELGLHHCELKLLPETIENLSSLKRLILDWNELSTIPDSIGNLKSLQFLYLGNNKLELIPDTIGDLKSILTLDLIYNWFTHLPDSIVHLKSLQTLYLRGTKIRVLPKSFGNLTSLERLDLSNATKLTSLPESFGDLTSLKDLDLSGFDKLTNFMEILIKLTSLQKLNLECTHLSELPEFLGTLIFLKELNLQDNQLKTLPKSFGNLTSLERLNLYHNKLETLPESFGNLSSLGSLNLEWNNLKELPNSFWRLKSLTNLKMCAMWEGDWKKIHYRDTPYILEFCRQRATINIFISHTVSEFASYRIKELAEHLEHQPEINQVFFCEEDLIGNIDAWMEETVPKSQLLLFIGTQQSIFNSRDCSHELFLARKHKIEVTPIKGVDVSWEDLIKVGLSRKLGFEFDEKEFNILCKDLYTYTCKFKRERDLIGKEQDKIKDNRLRIISLINDNLNFPEIDNFPEIERLENEFESNKIKFKEFLIKLGELLDQKDS